MKLTLFMAQTINGLIAREDYSEDFLNDANWQTFQQLAENAGCFIVGRTTYEQVKKWKDLSFDDVKAQKIVVSSNPDYQLDEGYLLSDSPLDALSKADEKGFDNVLLAGGGKLNSSFIKSGLIDEIIINIEPYLLGRGISIFSEEKFENNLKLIKVIPLEDGIVQLRYKVV